MEGPMRKNSCTMIYDRQCIFFLLIFVSPWFSRKSHIHLLISTIYLRMMWRQSIGSFSLHQTNKRRSLTMSCVMLKVFYCFSFLYVFIDYAVLGVLFPVFGYSCIILREGPRSSDKYYNLAYYSAHKTLLLNKQYFVDKSVMI